MKGRILVLKGQSLYNVLRIAADYMVQAFEKQEYEVTVIDLTISENLTQLIDILQQHKFSLIFSFQALLFDYYIQDQRISIFSLLNDTPVFGHIVDHPLYHSSRVEGMCNDNMYMGCIDISHVKYIKKCYSNAKNVVFLPHCGFLPEKTVPYEQRSIDVYFPSSYQKPSTILEQVDALPQVYSNIVKIIIDQMLQNPMLTCEDALQEYLDQIKFEYSINDFIELMKVVSLADQYYRAYTRTECIKALLDNGIKVTVSGSGWGEFEKTYDNINVISSSGSDFIDVLNTMANSKMVLNHAPTYQTGMHERIFSSMMCGAICLTHDFPILYEEFTDGENILLYSRNDLNSFANRINNLLGSPEKAKLVANSGNSIAKNYHAWECNAKKILEIVGL